VRTVTGLFDNYDDASDAVGELEAAGIPHSDISIVGKQAHDDHDHDSSRAAEDAAGGAGLGAVVGGAGGIVGALTESGVSESDAHVYAEGVRRGGTLVTARVDDALVTQAEAILRQTRSVDVEARRSEYQAGGWTGFDPDADDYTATEIGRDPSRNVNRI